MKRKDLKMNRVYKMKDGFYRKITGMFLSTNGERRFKTTTNPDSDYVELEYVHCYLDGQEIPKQKPRYCSSKTFARLVQEEVEDKGSITPEMGRESVRRIDLLISVLPKEEEALKQIDEIHRLKNEIARLLHEKGYRFIIADEEITRNSREGA